MQRAGCTAQSLKRTGTPPVKARTSAWRTMHMRSEDPAEEGRKDRRLDDPGPPKDPKCRILALRLDPWTLRLDAPVDLGLALPETVQPVALGARSRQLGRAGAPGLKQPSNHRGPEAFIGDRAGTRRRDAKTMSPRFAAIPSIGRSDKLQSPPFPLQGRLHLLRARTTVLRASSRVERSSVLRQRILLLQPSSQPALLTTLRQWLPNRTAHEGSSRLPVRRRPQFPRRQDECRAGQCMNLGDQEDLAFRLRHRLADRRGAVILQCLKCPGLPLAVPECGLSARLLLREVLPPVQCASASS